jgi:hypothetical protein
MIKCAWQFVCTCEDRRSVRLSLSNKSASHLAVFFSHNKSVNNTFGHGLSAKRTGRERVGDPTAAGCLSFFFYQKYLYFS